MQDKHRLARLLRDLDEIKAAVKRNSPVLREIVTARFYWWLILIFGAVASLFAVAMHLLVNRFGGYDGIPVTVRAVFWALAAAAGITMYVFRVRGVLLTIRRIDPRLTVWTLLGDHTIGEFFHLYGPLCLIAAGVTIVLSRTGNSYYIVGTWVLVMGMTWNLLGFSVHLLEYYVIGYWCLITAALSFLFPGVSASLWVAICAGGGSVVYAAAWRFMGTGKVPAREEDA